MKKAIAKFIDFCYYKMKIRLEIKKEDEMMLIYNEPILNRLDEEVERLLKKYDITSPPIDIKEICEKEGFNIIQQDMSELEKLHGKQISGMLFVGKIREDDETAKESKVISVKWGENPKRQRFTMAHELGHFFLHRNDEPLIISFRSDRSPREYEADEFAAKILMPKEMLTKHYEDMLIKRAFVLASKFNVSVPAMKYRLDNLGLVYFD
ncbi:MAG: ImmA/IrrE family metallo-endopeptidase [Defluviitaleaceae bacterium]|nr:ImmA/IrrE family metallo-endopeptidase [Defluviitaleaceae bacterium]